MFIIQQEGVFGEGAGLVRVAAAFMTRTAGGGWESTALQREGGRDRGGGTSSGKKKKLK